MMIQIGLRMKKTMKVMLNPKPTATLRFDVQLIDSNKLEGYGRDRRPARGCWKDNKLSLHTGSNLLRVAPIRKISI